MVSVDYASLNPCYALPNETLYLTNGQDSLMTFSGTETFVTISIYPNGIPVCYYKEKLDMSTWSRAAILNMLRHFN